jgi:cytochrome P450
MSEPQGSPGTANLMDAMDPAMAAEPQPLFKMMRETMPVVAMEGAVVLTRREDVDHALRHPEVFSSNWSAVDLGNVRPLIPLQIDPPDHVKYRRILDPLFGPRQMAVHEADITALVNEHIDRFIGNGEVDLARELTIPLPSQVFLTLLGLPLDDLELFLKWKDGIIRPDVATGSDREGEVAKTYQRDTASAIYEYFDRVLDQRQQERRDDVLSRFLDTEVEGERLTREEILDTCFLFFIAGLDTVTASLDCMFAYLAQHPEQRQRLVDDPSLIPSAVEEMLRWETPVTGVPRVALEETEIGGCPVHKGDAVMILLGSANTDEAELPDAFDVDLGRTENRHIAFGGGIHRCLGSHLARLELRVTLREFHRRIPEYALKPGTELLYTPGIRSIEHLPLVFTASA